MEKRIFSLLLILLFTVSVQAQIEDGLLEITEKDKKLPDNTTQYGRFGYCVAINKNFLLIGAPYEYVPINGVIGSAFIYTYDGKSWGQRHRLTPPEPHVYDGYGMSVAITDTLIIIGSPFDDEKGINCGAIYIYSLSNKKWIFDTKLTPEDGEGGYQFGYSVTVSKSGTIAVGSPALDEKELDGTVYIYTKENGSWMLKTKLKAHDGVKADEFGFAVDINGNSLAISAHWKNSDVLDSGVVFMYNNVNDEWIVDSVILPPMPTNIRHRRNFKDKRRFGTSIDIGDEYMVIGSPSERSILGGAFVYKKVGKIWIFYESLKQREQKLNEFNFFGRSVSIDREIIAVGSPTTNDKKNGRYMSGAVYIFEREGFSWVQKKKLVSTDSTEDHGLGASVAMHDGNVISGSVNDGDQMDGNGAAYIFETK